MTLDILLEQTEKQITQYYCIVSNNHRYDLVINHSEQFFGKAMVTSIQSGRMVLLCPEDIEEHQYWALKLGIEQDDLHDIKHFFYDVLQPKVLSDQY
ncbi:SAV0927 family protein [Bacillus sp. 165]|uniref:SAV0927 family protein n=1 Tax=Bacillus sp. 165 TaxID=1529117 RepID=UPI001ADB5400|nr:SAV0927 family protein [Bacillus sp. 165]MBO9131146.1 DUF3055 family protein [Bacillus sp. 165]